MRSSRSRYSRAAKGTASISSVPASSDQLERDVAAILGVPEAVFLGPVPPRRRPRGLTLLAGGIAILAIAGAGFVVLDRRPARPTATPVIAARDAPPPARSAPAVFAAIPLPDPVRAAAAPPSPVRASAPVVARPAPVRIALPAAAPAAAPRPAAGAPPRPSQAARIVPETAPPLPVARPESAIDFASATPPPSLPAEPPPRAASPPETARGDADDAARAKRRKDLDSLDAIRLLRRQ